MLTRYTMNTVYERYKHEDGDVRLAAVLQAMGALGERVQRSHARGISARLEDGNRVVR